MMAILAGEGRLPFLAVEGARRHHKAVLLLALRGMASEALVPLVDRVVWLDITELGKGLRACRRYQVDTVLMAGRVRHVHALHIRPWRLGWTSLRLWWSLKDKRADTLLKALGDLLGKKGISLGRYDEFLEDKMAVPGLLTHIEPSQAAKKEIPLGVRLAKGLGALDVGQTVVVKGGVVVAVEALEGTDACLERAYQLAGEGAVVVKLAKPHQDMRFDVPVIGLNTIEKLAKIKASLLVIEAGKTLIVDEECIAAADSAKVPIVALSQEEISKILSRSQKNLFN